MDDPTKLKKTAFGYMTDFRKAMGVVEVASAQCNRAYDVGDHEAVQHLMTIIGEAFQDIDVAARAVIELTKKEAGDD